MGLNISYKRMRCKGSCGRHKLLELLVTTEEGSYSMDETDLSRSPFEKEHKNTKKMATPKAQPNKFWEPDYKIVEWQGSPESNAEALNTLSNRKTLALPESGQCIILDTKV